MARLSLLRASLLLVYIAGVAGQGTISDVTGKVSMEFCYCLQSVVTNLKGPVTSVFFKDQTTSPSEERIIVVEQIGLANMYSKSGTFVKTFLDIRDRVVVTDTVGETRGLLSLVFDPAHIYNGKVYVYYIRNVGGDDYAYLSVFTTQNDIVDTSTEMTLLRILQSYVSGNGGPMLFGDDGYLYVMTGDGGEEDDKSGRAQNKNTFYGKVLRIDPDGPQSFTQDGFGKLYSVPSTNPFVNSTEALEEVYAYGIRNMWGCSQDVAGLGGSGQIICAETGTDKFDEIDVIKSGKNYGWNIKEGSQCLNLSNCQVENEGVPIYEFNHTSQHSLVGGYVYRGHAFPNFNASEIYTFGDVVTGKIYVLEENSTGSWTSLEWLHCKTSTCPSSAQATPLSHVFGFGRDLQGELYMLMSGGFVVTDADGAMFKIVPPTKSSSSRMMPPITWALVVLSMLVWSVGDRRQ